MKRLFLCFCTVALAAAPGCVLFGDETDDGSGPVDVLVADEGNLTDALTSLCDATVAANACHNDNSCSDGMHCFAPGEKNCGICMESENTCLNVEDCAIWPGTTCDYPLYNDCYCNWGKLCLPRCNTKDGTVCDSQDRPTCDGTGRCVAKPCQTDADCLDTFRCTTDDTGTHCERRTCTADGECGDCGWCVNGACYDEPGHCDHMAP